MAKLMCAKCGGKVKKMGNGGVTPSKAIPRASMGLNFGIPQTGTTNYSAPTMQKGGIANSLSRGLKKMNPAKIKYKDLDPGITITPKGPYKNMDPKFTKTPNKPYKNMDPGFSITPKINPGNKDVFKNAGPPPQPKGYKQMGGLIKRKK